MSRKRASSLLASMGALLLASCATTGHAGDDSAPRELVRSSTVEPFEFEVVFGAGDEESADDVFSALERAVPHLVVWGEPKTAVKVHILPTHEALGRAVGRRNYSWLRAWARYDEIFLQSPRTFDSFERGLGNLTELLTHELTHCLMYQRAAPKESWRLADRTIPIWFREGMASYTARQGHRRISEARLAEWRERTERDPLGEAASLYRSSPEIAYAAAHWAFAFLVERYGAQSIRDIMDSMREGHDFSEAFREVVGLTDRSFSKEFLRYLDWGGWIDRRRPRPGDVLVFERGGTRGADRASPDEIFSPATPLLLLSPPGPMGEKERAAAPHRGAVSAARSR